MIGDLLGQGALEALFYFTGKAVASVALPHIGIEPFERQRSQVGFRWRGFTYMNGHRRYLYTESIQFLGVMLWVVIGILIYVFVQAAR